MSQENGKFANWGRLSQKSKDIIVKILEPRQRSRAELRSECEESRPDSFLSTFEVNDSQPHFSCRARKRA